MKNAILPIIIGCLTCLTVMAVEPDSTADKLYESIQTGDRATIQALLKTGVDLHARDTSGDTPLMAAARHGDVWVLEQLLKAGAEVNATNDAGGSALMRAATFEDKARLLLSKKADVNARSHLGNTALILAARKAGNHGTVKLFLDQGADPNASNVFGATALMAAAAADDMESVRLLLEHGADVNAKPIMDELGDGFIWGGGRTPLMWAAYGGNESMVKLLLEHGAQVNDFTLAGGALGQASWGGHVGVARTLLDAGAEVDQRDLIAHYTPLHWAASSERSSSEMVELLLAHAADVNAEGGQPVDNFLGETQTPLMLARKRGDTPIVQALIKAGAKDLPTSDHAEKNKETAGTKTITEAIQRALPSLTRTAEDSVATFLKHASKQDCISCHQQQLPVAALGLAQSRNFNTDREALLHQISLMKRFVSSNPVTPIDARHTATEMGFQTTFHPEPAIMNGYVSLAFELGREPASEVTDSLVHQLFTMQHRDGHWSRNLPRPPIQASDITATTLAVHTIKTFSLPTQQQDMKSSLRRARKWLAQAEAETNEERAHQLLGIAWAGGRSAALKKLAEELIRQQRADGGWGQLAGLDSDAYGTGQSLYALIAGGKVSVDHPAVRRGMDFLMRTQLADGTWHVSTRTHPFQPPMDSGFPHGKDGWISAAGTSWAVMALALSLDPSQIPPATLALTNIPASTVAASGNEIDKITTPVEFTHDIQPMLERSCLTCHSGEKPKGGFALIDRAAVLKGGNRGEPVLVPGEADAGAMIRVVQGQIEDLEMPPLGKREKYPALTSDDIAKLRAWIDQGALWPEGLSLSSGGH